MLKNTCCCICLSINKRTINIYKTDLQYAYETLANFKIKQDECWTCYICHMRLHQCHQLQRLAVQTRGLVDDMFQNKIEIYYGAFDSILELSTSEMNITSYIIQTEGEAEPYNENDIEQDKILENTNDYHEVKKEPPIEFEDTLIDIKQEFSNVDDIVAQEKDEGDHQNPTTHSITEIYPEDREENTFFEQKIKQEFEVNIEDKGIEQEDEQDNTNDCKGRDHVSEAQADLYKDPLSCDVCLKNFAFKSKLIAHMRSHTGVQPYRCNICSKKFKQIGTLNRHTKIHTGERPFSCNICLKTFSEKRYLHNHKIIHTGEKPFSCDVCSKSYAQKSTLYIHKQIHVSNKPFSCDVCLKKFTYKQDLKSHTLVHTGEQPFSCEICLRKFSDKRNLNKHILTHTDIKPFSCHICFKNFRIKQHLKNHILVHTGEKPFSCDICSKGFGKKINFTRHMLIHTGDKQFSCDICSKSFTRKDSLNVHKQSHLAVISEGQFC